MIKITVTNGTLKVNKIFCNKWVVVDVFPERNVPRGIYYLSNSISPNDNKTYKGEAIFMTKNYLFQLVDGKKVVKHKMAKIDCVPTIGTTLKIEY